MFNNKPIFGWSLLPLCLTLVFFGLWRFSQIPFLAWLGIVTAIMGMALPVVALIMNLNQNEKKTSGSRILTLVFKSILTGLSVVICWSSYGSFSKSNPQSTKTVRIKNTTDKIIPELELRYGSGEMKIKLIPARETRTVQIPIFAETSVKASIKAPDGTERYTQFMLGPENKWVQILIDWNQNLMADVM
ncbi:MAG: hypothetical protein IV090_14375 [Candidatus Sericytochromatia bacterium]|nr:hypothetical protein [Candidatus Sericytochromatia bacterium]